MTELTLPAATLSALRTRHLAYLDERLTNEAARADFVRSFVSGYDHLLCLPLRSVVDPKALVDGLAAVLSQPAVQDLGAPIAREIHARTLAQLRIDTTKLGDYVPARAREAIDALLARPDLVPAELVRRVFDEEATEEVLRDVLYDALVEFNETVNPFFADWGLPGLLKRFMPIGSGAVLKSLGAVRAEFDKRLEPEMRKFLLVFSRKSKRKIADFVVSKSADPKFIALRKTVVAFFYEQTLETLVKGHDDKARAHADVAAEQITLEVVRRDHPRERLRVALEELLRAHGDEPIGMFLAGLGVTAKPELEALAELLWPYVKLTLQSPPARAFYERIVWEFYESIETDKHP